MTAYIYHFQPVMLFWYMKVPECIINWQGPRMHFNLIRSQNALLSDKVPECLIIWQSPRMHYHLIRQMMIQMIQMVYLTAIQVTTHLNPIIGQVLQILHFDSCLTEKTNILMFNIMITFLKEKQHFLMILNLVFYISLFHSDIQTMKMSTINISIHFTKYCLL